MKMTEIRKKIMGDLHVGARMGDHYMKLFKSVYKGAKQAIDSFEAKYTDGGESVTFIFLVTGEEHRATFPIPDWRYDYEK